MPENPLLPHRELKELYLLMLRCRDLERKRRAHGGRTRAREALLAATTMQMLPGDLLCGEPGDATAVALAPPGKTAKLSGTLTVSTAARLTACAGAALGIKSAGVDGLVLAFTRAGAAEAGWQEAIEWAHAQAAPLVVLCEDAVGGGKPKTQARIADTVTWTALERLSKRLRLPILAVDGEDAVAVYRAMQESAVRARGGAGMAIVWAVTTPRGTKLAHSQQPLARLLSYLKVRKISPPKRP